MLPVAAVEDQDFILMMEIIDKRQTVPKKTKISNLIEKHDGQVIAPHAGPLTRLLRGKDSLSTLANEMGWDSLLSCEWQKL